MALKMLASKRRPEDRIVVEYITGINPINIISRVIMP